MGCCGNKPITQFDTKLEMIQIQKYDEFYLRASNRLVEIKRDMKDIEERHARFLVNTGLVNRDLTLGHGLAAMLVAVASENECDFIAVNLQFDTNFPGILIDKTALSEDLRTCYQSWIDLSIHLAISIDKLSGYVRDVPLFYAYAKVVPDELLKKAFDEGLDVNHFKAQEEIAVANQERLTSAQQSLEQLLDRTFSAIHDTTDTIDRIRTNTDIVKALSEIAVRANQAGISSVPSILARYEGQIGAALELTSK